MEDKAFLQLSVIVCSTILITCLGGCGISEYFFNQNLKTGHHEVQLLGKEGTLWVPDNVTNNVAQ